ncbi:MAG: transposase, partial [Chromatiales bacterium]
MGINIAMGLKVMSEYSDYWSEHPLFGCPYIKSVMAKRRYEKLCQYLHCSLPTEEAAGDKLRKVRPFITRCNERFCQIYSPSQNLSMDEAMIEYNGRLSWKQYLPLKPVKWGIKLWCLCDSDTGYCLKFEVYTGAAINVAQGKGLGYRVVMGLTDLYLNTNRHVFADNYFTSVPLAEVLLQHNTYLCGTTRASRKEFPNALGDLYMRQGDSAKWTNENGVMLVKWHDKRDVCLISTDDDGKDAVKAVRRKGQVIELAVPHVVQRYNASMGGVD